MVITVESLGIAALIFFLRVLNNAIFTVRLIMVARQRKVIAFIMGFVESLIFAVTFSRVAADLTDLVILMAYCVGFAAGSYVGMALEARFVTSYMIVNVFTGVKGHEIAVALRDAGFGVTETIGEGRDGKVTTLRSVVSRRDMTKVLDTIRSIQPEAFIAVEEARSVERGWLRANRTLEQE